MKSDIVPLVGGISKHESLISRTHVFLSFFLVNSGGDVGVLCMNIDDDLAVVAIKADFLTGEANFLGNSSCLFLKVDLSFID